MIYDCFLYNGEADMLELRLNELDGVVDTFVIVEGRETFTGVPKEPLTDNGSHILLLSGYSAFCHHAQVAPAHATAWQREAWQRNAIGDALRAIEPQPDDIILVSDVDEIPKAKAVSLAADLIRGGERQVAFQQDVYFYHPQCLNLLRWYGTRAIAYRNLHDPQSLRATEYTREGEAVIAGAGWHFSYFMDTATIQRKLAAYSHTEVNVAPYNTAENIEAAMRECRSLVPTDGQRFTRVTHAANADLPAYMLANPERYGLEVAACVS